MAQNKTITILCSAMSQNTDIDDLVRQISNAVGKRCRLTNDVRDCHGKRVKCEIELHKDCDDNDRKNADDICKSHIAVGDHKHRPCGEPPNPDPGAFETTTTNTAVTQISLGTAPADITVFTSGLGCNPVGSANGAGNGGGRALAFVDSTTASTAFGSQFSANMQATVQAPNSQGIPGLNPLPFTNSAEISFDFKVDSASGVQGDVSSVLTILMGDYTYFGSQIDINLKTNANGGVLLNGDQSQGEQVVATAGAYLPNAWNSISLKLVNNADLIFTLNGVQSSFLAGWGSPVVAFYIQECSSILMLNDIFSTNAAHTQRTLLVDNLKIVVS